MDLNNKVAYFLGDSITEGYGASSIEATYHQLIRKWYGLKEAVNYGISGTRIAKQFGPSIHPDDPFCRRVDRMDDQADVVVVFGGTNDFGHGDAALGIFGSKDENTFYGACAILMEKLLEKYAGKEIVFMTPLHRADEMTLLERGEQTTPLCDYVTAICESAAFYSIPVLDLYAESGIQPMIPAQREKYCIDEVHLNDLGHERIARKLSQFLLQL